MARLFDRNWTRKQLLERIGDPSQIATVRPHTLTEGRSKGVAAIELSTGSGFRFTVLADRALDVSAAEHNGRSLCWRSCTGDTAPEFYQPEGLEWLRGFFGGLVCTCGLTHFGAPCVDEGVPLGLHGRISNTPAQEVRTISGWKGDDYVVGVRGKVMECKVFGPCLCLSRSIFAFLGQNKLYVHDEVTNLDEKPAPHMMLYHINFGFPVVDAGSRLASPSLCVTPRDADAEDRKAEYASFHAPATGYREKVYHHDVAAAAGGRTMAGVVNPALGFGAYVVYRKTQLPHLIEWKQLGKGTYVVGVEPATNLVQGRAKERAEGRLRMLKPGETVQYDLELGALTTKSEVAAFESAVRKIQGNRRARIGSFQRL